MPTAPNWQLQKPISAVIFDCDGTLSAIEGIDELAKEKNVGDAVHALTEKAMGKTGINPDLYRQRLELVKPNKQQVEKLGEKYITHLVPDASGVIQSFQRLNKIIYIVTAGLSPAIIHLAARLNIPRENIFSVDIEFDAQGNYQNFNHHSPMTKSNGKREIVSQLKAVHNRVAHIGDGMNDFVAHDVSTRFIGYGGVFFRKNIAAECEFYIKSTSLSAMLPLLLTQQEIFELMPTETELYHKGMSAIQNGLVKINPATDKQK